ncbi:MFS transporter [Chenggangzhangella methanolivorans]|uniref:MFS transporter n=1 Tax=Chenggangzhangella methanolivorans TaxID=1437009 RepID=UPI003613CCFB
MKLANIRSSGQTTERILLASLIGTAVEFYDFYIYATAASLIFGPLFFPTALPGYELLGAYASFGIAFIARPLGGAVFGHFGDRVGRKTTLVASLLLMGASTAAIGFLPTYAVAGWVAPFLLCLLRFGQGLALGGEWTGATLLALENAPPGWRARFAMFAPLGAPIGFILANGLFLILTLTLTSDQFRDWGWRVPFLLSAPLVWMGLWVRLNLLETAEFAKALMEAQPPRVPLLELMRTHTGQVIAGTFGVVACFSLYYTATAFALGYGTTTLGYSRSSFLVVELGAILFMAAGIVAASWLSDRLYPERVLIFGCAGTILSGILLAPMLGAGSLWIIFIFLAFSLLVMGFVNGPLGAWLPSLFPARVRYTGTSVAFNLGGILGGAFSPTISQALAEQSGLAAVGFYLALTGGVSLIAFDASARKRALGDLARSEKRYRSIFEQTHVSLLEIDFSYAHEKLVSLRARGVVDLAEHARDAQAFCSECVSRSFVVDANEATVRMLGHKSRDDILGPLDRILPGKDDIITQLLETMWRGEDRFEREIEFSAGAKGNGTALLVIALPEEATAYERLACAMIDVTEREQAKEALIAAQEELARAGRISTVGAVSASIAHEVNQPIGAMVMSAQACLRWLRRDPPDLDEATLAAERAVRDGLRAGDIVQRTREQLRRTKRRPEAVDLRSLAVEASGLLERELSSISATVDVQSTGPSLVTADRVELQQVIVNLMSNGLHAMMDVASAQRRLVVTVGPSGDDLVSLTVRDFGAGIDAANLAKLFDPFFTTKREGMGIGLAICKSIVEGHDGSLAARNNEDCGATFEVRLPKTDPDAIHANGAEDVRAVLA